MVTTQSGNNFESTFPFRDGKPMPRPLYVNFDDFTEGDPEFKKELVTEVIANIGEFRQALFTAIDENNPQVFSKACHKIKFTLSMLSDAEFNSTIEELEKDMASPDKAGNFSLRSKHFEHLCNSIIRSLTIEIHGSDLP